MVTAVLGIFANPKGTDALRLQNEQRLMQHCLALSQCRDSFELVTLSAATVDDVRRALLVRQYDVVHFSGHGDFAAPLIRWLITEAAKQGFPRSSLSRDAVFQAAKQAKQHIMQQVIDDIEGDETFLTTIPLASMLLSEGPVDEAPAKGCSIELTHARLLQLGAGALAFEDEHGHLSPPNPMALAELLVDRGVRVVILNACETHFQAQLLQRQGVPFVVAAETRLSDQASTSHRCGLLPSPLSLPEQCTVLAAVYGHITHIWLP